MNILIINASPKNKGNISQMLGVMADEAVAIGATVQQVRIADLTVRPCTGCMRCRTANQCALPVDDAQRVLEMIKWCDAMVVGAPCYWGNMPGVLKVVFDRIVYGMMGESPRGCHAPCIRASGQWWLQLRQRHGHSTCCFTRQVVWCAP